MKKKICAGLLAFIILFFACCTDKTPQTSVSSTLSAKEIDALKSALDDEYKAHATYQRVIEKFGETTPFSNIIEAEETHIAGLTALFNAYGLEVPADEWATKAPVFDSIQDACEAGVQAEIDNAALYDQLLQDVTHEDIKQTFERLRDASRNNHLPAFQKCAQRRQ